MYLACAESTTIVIGNLLIEFMVTDLANKVYGYSRHELTLCGVLALCRVLATSGCLLKSLYRFTKPKHKT